MALLDGGTARLTRCYRTLTLGNAAFAGIPRRAAVPDEPPLWTVQPHAGAARSHFPLVKKDHAGTL